MLDMSQKEVVVEMHWFDDIGQWTTLKDYGEVKRSAEDCVAWRAITSQPST